MSKSVGYPDPHTWDFKVCLPDEITPCLYYEYSRESPRARAYFQAKERSASTAACFGVEYSAQAFQEFPATPWLGLKIQVRREFLRLLAQPKGYGPQNNELLIEGDFLPEFTELLQDHNDGFMHDKPTDRAGLFQLRDRPSAWAAVELDWSKSNNALKADFERLLKLRPAEFRKKPPGRNNHRDLLNGLAAKRLRDFCKINRLHDPPNKAIQIWGEYIEAERPRNDEKCPYGDARALRASIKRADHFMKAAFWLGEREG